MGRRPAFDVIITWSISLELLGSSLGKQLGNTETGFITSTRVIQTIKETVTSNVWDSQEDYKLTSVFHSLLGSGNENQRAQGVKL